MDNHGPDPEKLRQLHASLPDMVKEVERKNALRTSVKATKTTPRKACRICGRLFDYGIVQGTPMPDLGECDRCEKLLKDGYIAFISADSFCFAKSKTELKDMAGTVQELNPAIFKKLVEQHQLECCLRESHGKNDNKSDSKA